MALTEQQFDAWWKENGIESSTFAEKSAARKGWNAAISALPKLEPAEDFICRFRRHVGGDGEFWLHELEDFYTESPIAPHASAPSEQKPVYQFRPECENWIDCTEQFYESWRGEKRELYAAPQPDYKAQRDAERLNADTLREPINGDEWRVEWWNESCRMMLPAGMILDCFQAYKNGTLQFTIKKRAAIASVKGGA